MKSQNSLLAVARDRRTARAAQRNLERELAGFSTAAELRELDAIVVRHPDDEVAGIRQIIDRRRAA
jgi:hypothetical protein